VSEGSQQQIASSSSKLDNCRQEGEFLTLPTKDEEIVTGALGATQPPPVHRFRARCVDPLKALGFVFG
jgi:hypothetical protein